MGAAEVVAVLRANTSEFTAKIGEAEAQVTKLTKSGASNFEKLGAVGKVAAFGVAAAAVGIGVAAVDLGLKAQNAGAQLDNAFKNAGTNTDKYKSQIAGVDAQLTKYGYSNAETETALARLVQVTGNAQQSLKDMGLAADIARARHIDLNSATDLLAKTMAGNITAAKRMGIEIPAAIQKMKDPVEKSNAIMAILEGHFKGSAAAAADTFSGRMSTLKAQAENLGESFGKRLIPILEKLVTQISQVVTWFEKHKAIAEALGIAISTILVVAIGAYIVSMASAAVATIAATWPILLIIAAVAAVGVGIFELATHWKQVWTDIKNWTDDAIQFIRNHFWMIMAIPIVGWIIDLAAHWQAVWAVMQSIMQTAWSVLGPIFNFIKTLGTDVIIANITILQAIWNTGWTIISTAVSIAWAVIKPVWDLINAGIGGIQTVMNTLSAAWSSIWNGLGSAITYAYNTYIAPAIAVIQGAVNAVKSAWDAVFGGGGGGGSAAGAGAAAAAAVPHRAAGGPLHAGQTALVGENGPELFTPGSSGTVIPNHALGGGGGDQPITIVVQVAGEDVGKAILPSLLKLKRTGGYGTLQLS